MKIAVEGCAHGELEKIYEVVAELENQQKIKVDLLICCGDFQSTRNLDDLDCMAVPKKHQDICSFYKYYSGVKKAPVLTIFIGGNHEASNYLQELPYGGWVAPNIYYLGYAGVVQFNGVRIAGLSGIYKGHDYFKGHFESAPYDENAKRSVYHQRQLEVFRLSQLTPGSVDVCLSHDWPKGITNYGNVRQLLKFKPFLRDDIENERLGSKPCEELLHKLKPKFWFSAHLHCKFSAVIPHDNEMETKFLALDKCLPKRRFLQILDVEEPTDAVKGLQYDLEWLTILFQTNHLLNVKPVSAYMPGPNGVDRYQFCPTEGEKAAVHVKFGQDLKIPENFTLNSPPYDPAQNKRYGSQPDAQVNMQTTQFCEKLGIDDPLSLVLLLAGRDLNYSTTSQDTNLTFTESLNTSTSLLDTSAPLASTLPKPMWVDDKNPDQIDLDDEEDTDEKLIEAFTAKYSTPLKSFASPRTKLVLPSPMVEQETLEEQKVDQTQNDSTTESASKRFKRRNQNVYDTTTE